MPAQTDLAPTERSPGLPAFWSGDLAGRVANFAALGSTLSFHPEHSGGRGFWSAVTYDHVQRISSDPVTFSSASGFTIDDLPREVLDFAASMIARDDPEHARLRRIVQHAFTVRSVRRIGDDIAAHAHRIVEAIPTGTFDFVEHVASQLPLRVICDMVGVPEADRPRILGLSDVITGSTGDDFTTGPGSAPELFEVYQYALELGAIRAKHPTGDIVSRLVADTALTPAEFGSFFILLVTAGHETVKQALTWALHLLTTHPCARELLLENFDAHITGFTDEVLRYSSPTVGMRRTATRDVDIDRVSIAAGDKVVLWYLAANHDPRVFADPQRFDIGRPNGSAHVGFGALSPHHCLGANLARTEIRELVGALLHTHPDIHSTAEPVLTNSAFVNGVAALSVTA